MSLLRTTAVTSYLGLIVLTLLWEGWLAPAAGAAPGFWLTVKSLPLLIPLFGVLHDRHRAYTWACLLVLVYFTEGIVIAFSERHAGLGIHSSLIYAILEILLCVSFFVSAAYRTRALRSRGL